MNDLTLRDEICIENAIFGEGGAADPAVYADEIVAPVEHELDDLDNVVQAVEDDTLRGQLDEHIKALRGRLETASGDIASALNMDDTPYRSLRDVCYDLECLGFTIARVR